MISTHSEIFFDCVKETCSVIDTGKIENLARALLMLRTNGGRLFFIGVGGSAANCSHAVNDFRKLCGIKTFTPVDNVAELTARANDEGWNTIFGGWLLASNFCDQDALFVLSVGGGDLRSNVSVCIVNAVDLARSIGAKVFGIIGRASGYTAKHGDAVIVIPEVKSEWVTPLSEAFQSVVLHCLVSHPLLQINKTKW